MRETLIIEIPRPHTVSDLDTVRREAAEKAYQEAVFDLIRQGEISSGYGADLLGTNRVDMMEQLRQQGIPVADYSVGALREKCRKPCRISLTKGTTQADADCLQHHAYQ
jgi:predicted HTH domain antitoxin